METENFENVEEKIDDTVESVESAVEETVESATGYDPVDIPEPDKGSKKGLFIGLGIAGIAVVIGVVIAFVLGVFMSPAQMLAKGIANGKDDFVAAYDAGYKSIEENYANVNGDMQMSVNVELGAQAQALVKQAGAEAGVDLSWVKNGQAEIAMDIQDKQMGFEVKAGVNDTEIGTVDAILDTASEKMYLAIPGVIDGAIEADASDMDMDQVAEALATYTETFETYLDRYPTAEELDKVLTTYTDILAKDLALANIQKSKVELTASGITSKCVDLSMDLDKKTVLQLELDMIDALKEDNDLKEIARPMVEPMLESPEYADYFEDYDQFWDMMMEEVVSSRDDVASELESVKADDTLNEVYGKLHLYGGAGFKLKGFAFEPKDEEGKLECFVVEKGDESALLVNGDFDTEVIKFEGKGTKDGDIFNGKYEFTYNDEKMFTLEVADFDTKEFAEKRNYKGHFIFAIGDGLTELLDDDSLAMLAMAKYDISMNTEGLDGEMKIDVITGEDSLASVTFAYKMSDVDDMSIPAKTYNMDTMSDEQSYNFIKSLNLAPVVSNLKAAGVPESLMTPLQQLSDALASGDDYAIMEAFSALTGETSASDSYASDDDLAYLASLSYDDFATLYKAYYNESATDEEIKMYYDMIQEYYGE